MKRTAQSFVIQLAFFLLSFICLQNIYAMDASYDPGTKILDIPALQINNDLLHVVLQLDNYGCLQLLSSSPATEPFTGAVYDPATTTATLQSVKIGNENYKATIQFKNGCFSVASATAVTNQGGASVTGATRITYDFYEEISIGIMRANDAPADLLVPFDKIVTLSGSNMRAEDVGTLWAPDVNGPIFPMEWIRVDFRNIFVYNDSGHYAFNEKDNKFIRNGDGGSMITDSLVFPTFLRVDEAILDDNISVLYDVITGVKVGDMTFAGKPCVLYDIFSDSVPGGQVCLTHFSNVKGAVALYFGLDAKADSAADGYEHTFYKAKKIEEGIAINTDTFKAP